MSSSSKLSDRHLRIHEHGHRCFNDGLNSFEQEVLQVLTQGLDSRKYYIFNNIILPSENPKTTQVDHIVVSESGIFVIESKDYGGWIFGYEKQKMWTQILFKKKYHFQNPLLQNVAHIFALKNQLPFLKKCIFSIIVFSERSEIKTEMPSNVIQKTELIERILSKEKVLLEEAELMMVIGKLSMLCQTAQVSNIEHVHNLNEAYQRKNIEQSTIYPQTNKNTHIPVKDYDDTEQINTSDRTRNPTHLTFAVIVAIVLCVYGGFLSFVGICILLAVFINAVRK